MPIILDESKNWEVPELPQSDITWQYVRRRNTDNRLAFLLSASWEVDNNLCNILKIHMGMGQNLVPQLNWMVNTKLD